MSVQVKYCLYNLQNSSKAKAVRLEKPNKYTEVKAVRLEKPNKYTEVNFTEVVRGLFRT